MQPKSLARPHSIALGSTRLQIYLARDSIVSLTMRALLGAISLMVKVPQVPRINFL